VGTKLFIVSFLFLLMMICGCITQYPGSDNSNVSKFAEEVKGNQHYYDELVLADPLNSTAWTIRGMYYTDNFNQYETALQSYERALELDPENSLAWYAKGVTLQNMQRLNESQICFENAEKYGFHYEYTA